MTTFLTIIGAALIFVALRDIFQQLFNPSGGGSLAKGIMKTVWGLFRLVGVRRRAVLSLAGPFTLLAIITSWVVLLAVGWALVYWPRLPEAFSFSTPLNPANQTSFIDALYLSLYTLSTLGYGTITPSPGWLKIFAMLEALAGFGLLTAGVTWVISLYPAFARRHSLARDANLVRESELQTGSAIEDDADSEAAERVLAHLASGLVTVRGDLNQFPVTYYFHNTEERSALPVAMPYLLELARKTDGEDRPPEVRRRSAALRSAVEDFSQTIASKTFLGLSSKEPDEILRAYARHHLWRTQKDYDSDQD